MKLKPVVKIAQPSGPGFVNAFNWAKDVMVRQAEDAPYGKAAIKDPEFRIALQTADITPTKTPLAFLGAYTARVAGDVVSDQSRGLYWRYNHPLAIADKALQKTVDPKNVLGPYGRGVIGLAAVQPAVALTGSFDPTNISELGRPKGYKQNAPDPEDPTQTLEPGTELFQRFFQGRTGRPLAYPKAQEEIPDLTKARYANYMNFLYNDPGMVGKATLGILKTTPENLQGNPEARLFGYPISIPSVTALAGGLAGARTGISLGNKPSIYKKGTRTQAVARGLAGGAIGSATGAVAGVLMNQAIAAAGNTDYKLPMQ